MPRLGNREESRRKENDGGQEDLDNEAGVAVVRAVVMMERRQYGHGKHRRDARESHKPDDVAPNSHRPNLYRNAARRASKSRRDAGQGACESEFSASLSVIIRIIGSTPEARKPRLS